MSHLFFATANQHKLNEVQALLPNYQITSLQDCQQQQVAENGSTFIENALIKANAYSQNHDCYVIAEDSGLQVDILQGNPGIHSARYAGNNATDEANNRKLQAELTKHATSQQQLFPAQFSCTIALVKQQQTIALFFGSIQGVIHLNDFQQANAFGYDPLFIPQNYQQPLSKLGATIKNKISHRSQAVQKLAKFLA